MLEGLERVLLEVFGTWDAYEGDVTCRKVAASLHRGCECRPELQPSTKEDRKEEPSRMAEAGCVRPH